MLETVEKKYTPYIGLYIFLMKFKIVGVKRHRFSLSMSLMRSGIGIPSPKPHWIQCAIIGTALEFIEFVPYKERDV